MQRTCRNCQGTGKWTKGPRPEQCLHCDGKGQQFIGMTFEEAVILAGRIISTSTHNPWHLAAITFREDSPFFDDEEQVDLYTVDIWRAMTLGAGKPGIVRVTLEDPEQWPPTIKEAD